VPPPIRNRQGQIAGAVLIFRDITERRNAERAAKEALDYAENIIATLRHPFLVVLDEDLRVVTANRSFYRTFHVSAEETENRLVYELGDHQWDIPALRKLLEEVLPTNHALHDFEVEHDFPSIGRKIMLLNARRIERANHDNRRSELILLAIEDITERRAMEAKLQASEVRYRRLFESAKDGILLLHLDTGVITDANPFMTELLGYSYDELIGKELWEIGLFKDAEESRAAFQVLQERGYIRYSHLPLQTRSDQKVEVEFVSNVYQEDHTPVIQCNIRDNTAHRKMELAMLQAEAMADMNRRKDEFLAMLSHELRNPLAPIMNAVHLLRLEGQSESPVQHEARLIIERQVAQVSHLVDDLLEVSRITTGRIRLHKENTDLRGVVDRAVEAVRPLIDQQKHDLKVSQPAEPVWLHADSTRIEQVIVNLLNNAAKYTEAGGRIRLSVQREGDEAVLRLRDTGVGIALNLLPCIFDLFTQAERSLDRSQGGLGVGLTLVKRLVELHGGTVEAQSVLGRGSEFVVRLPILHLSMDPGPSTPAKAANPTGAALRVLVVDDNVDAANSAAMLLRATAGHDVRAVYSSQAALEAASEYRPNVILLDIGLPEIDGYEVARRLRQQPELKDVRLIALTGYGMDVDRHRSHAAGFDHHLVKPFDLKQLQQVLRTPSDQSP
jgi:PAS domain S-box-containing protein